MSNLQDVLAKAKAQAENLPVTQTAAFPSAPALPSASYNMDMESFLNRGGMEVESYVQVKDAGFRLNKDWTGYLDVFTAIIDLTEVQPFMGIRKEVGKEVTYAKTYDGRTTTRGEDFGTIVQQFKAQSQKPADPYPGFDIPMTLVGDYADPKDAKKSLADGTVVGLSTSITGYKPFASFMKKLTKQGLGHETIVVKITHSPRRNSANQEYGVAEFEFISIDGAVDEAA